MKTFHSHFCEYSYYNILLNSNPSISTHITYSNSHQVNAALTDSSHVFRFTWRTQHFHHLSTWPHTQHIHTTLITPTTNSPANDNPEALHQRRIQVVHRNVGRIAAILHAAAVIKLVLMAANEAGHRRRLIRDDGSQDSRHQRRCWMVVHCAGVTLSHHIQCWLSDGAHGYSVCVVFPCSTCCSHNG